MHVCDSSYNNLGKLAEEPATLLMGLALCRKFTAAGDGNRSKYGENV